MNHLIGVGYKYIGDIRYEYFRLVNKESLKEIEVLILDSNIICNECLVKPMCKNQKRGLRLSCIEFLTKLEQYNREKNL